MGNIEDLVRRVSVLVEPMHDGFGYARLLVDELGLPDEGDKRWLRTAHVRSEVYDYLCTQQLDGWSLDRRRHGQNGAVHLSHDAGDLAVRLLREAPTAGGVPCAGSNELRRAYYRNQPYGQLPLWGKAVKSSHNLLILWTESEDEILLRMVRPVGPGTASRGVPIDLSAALPRTRTDFEAMRFEVVDEDLEEETVMYDEEDGSGGSA